MIKKIIIFTFAGFVFSQAPPSFTLKQINIDGNAATSDNMILYTSGLKNGQKVQMKDVNLGDILENGIQVCGKLTLKGDKENPYYKIWSYKLNDYIYVTGSHKIFNNRMENNRTDKLSNYVEVKDYINAEKTNYYADELSCLITSNHNIPIGEYTFWDWED